MPPRLNVWSTCRALSIRSTQPVNQLAQPTIAARARCFSDRSIRTPSDKSSNQFKKLMAQKLKARAARAEAENPEQPEQPEQEEQIEEAAVEPEKEKNKEALRILQQVAYGINPADASIEGHKFGLPELPLPSDKHVKHRYDPIVDQMTRLLMEDGKLGKAQRDMAMILNYLRTSPPPRFNPSRPLVAGAPPAAHLPLNPVLYFSLAVETIAPLVGVLKFAGIAGGGKALEVPVPLPARKRRRIAFNWILETARKKPSKGSGRTMFAHRVAEEIVAVVEGRSTVWDKRHLAHRIATAARANLNHAKVKGLR
ncbi:ribosomal protein S7 domain-containing protein [Apodospora peruviana]|uniref:Small ribosomal subunit protein uS7m n=1 Tax=Apodospora peruviana TaxID=516989 RepID=A0AAE0I0L3_9PEZI|nr:ribosomal protein S7 domain-containing protein [Apodospora peruviana]